MIDVLKAKLISLTEACQELESRPHVSTLWRWATKGIKGIKLQTVVVGGRRFTTAEFLSDFVASLSNLPGSDGIPPSREAQQRQNAAADRAKVIFDRPDRDDLVPPPDHTDIPGPDASPDPKKTERT